MSRVVFVFQGVLLRVGVPERLVRKTPKTIREARRHYEVPPMFRCLPEAKRVEVWDNLVFADIHFSDDLEVVRDAYFQSRCRSEACRAAKVRWAEVSLQYAQSASTEEELRALLPRVREPSAAFDLIVAKLIRVRLISCIKNLPR